jgi:predicted nucleotidyltransferase/DNA-binding XRE family transcriptional regulator
VDAAGLIRNARHASGLPQAVVASRARTSQQAIADYEHGHKQPEAETLQRILAACGYELALKPLEQAPAPLRALLDAQRDVILRIARRHGARNVRVFGSVARGDEQESSDLDLLVDLQPGRTLLTLVELIDDLSGVLGVPLDVATPELLKPEIREQALREAILV